MSWAGRKGTKTQLCTRLGFDCKCTFSGTHTHTRARMCISRAAVEHRASEAGCILRTLISCFRMSHSHTHTHTITEVGSLWSCGQPLDQALYEWRTAEAWSLLPLSACIPSWLTAICQNTWTVSGKLCIKVCHLQCHWTKHAEIHVASNTKMQTDERKKWSALYLYGYFSFKMKNKMEGFNELILGVWGSTVTYTAHF